MISVTVRLAAMNDNRYMIRAEALFAQPSERSSLDTPLDHLKACHRRIEERLDTLERAAARLGSHRDRALEAFESAFHFLDTSGVLHTEDEEVSIFPRLKPLLEPGERSYLAGLEHDHAEAHQIYAQLKDVYSHPDNSAQVKEVVTRFVKLYREHIKSEDDMLQSYAAQHLQQDAIQAISAEMKARRNLATA